MFVLEEYERAVRRGAHIYAEVGGYATRCNAYHMTGLKTDGREMAEAIRAALDRVPDRPHRIDYVNAHGSGTKQNDRHETAAFKRSLGEHAYDVPVSSIKSMVGHSLGAIGSIEIAACALAMKHNVVPPTANLHDSRPRVRPGLRAADGARAAGGHRADRRQRLRRVPERHGPAPSRGGSGMSATVITGMAVAAPTGLGSDQTGSPRWPASSGIGELTRFDTSGHYRPAGRPDRGLRRRGAPAEPAAAADRRVDPATRSPPPTGRWRTRAWGRTRSPTTTWAWSRRAPTADSSSPTASSRKLWSKGPEFVSVYESFAWFYAVNTGQISIRHGMRGPSAALVAEQAGGLDALGHARRTVRGGTELVLAGGVDSAFDPWGWASQLAGGLVSTVDDPAAAYLPVRPPGERIRARRGRRHPHRRGRRLGRTARRAADLRRDRRLRVHVRPPAGLRPAPDAAPGRRTRHRRRRVAARRHRRGVRRRRRPAGAGPRRGLGPHRDLRAERGCR